MFLCIIANGQFAKLFLPEKLHLFKIIHFPKIIHILESMCKYLWYQWASTEMSKAGIPLKQLWHFEKVKDSCKQGKVLKIVMNQNWYYFGVAVTICFLYTLLKE